MVSALPEAPYAKRLILHVSSLDAGWLDRFVACCLRDEVVLVCVIGDGRREIEDFIDELLVGDATVERRTIITTSHPGETVEQVKDFAARWTLDVDPDEPVQEVWAL